jgi:hypothetical protein
LSSAPAGAQAVIDYSRIETVPPTQVGKVNAFVAEVMNKRFDRMGIPANDNRRIETIAAMRTQAKGIAQAGSALAGAGRAIGWAGAAISAYGFIGDLMDRAAYIDMSTESFGIPAGAPVNVIDGQLMRAGVRISGKDYPTFYPAAASGSDQYRYQANAGGTTRSFVAMGARGANHGSAISIQVANTVTDYGGNIVYPGIASIIGGISGGYPYETWEMVRRAYRAPVSGVLQAKKSWFVTTTMNVTATAGNGAQACSTGVAENLTTSYPCSMLAQSDVEGPVPIAPFDAVRLLPVKLGLANAASSFLAFIIDKLWSNAAAQPGFGGAGASYSYADPITSTEVEAVKAIRPDLYPQMIDLAAPMAQTAFGGNTVTDVPIPATAPAASPSTNPGTGTGTGTTTAPVTVDLGADPGTTLAAPAETAWSSITDPFKITPPAFTLATEQCPTFSANLPAFSRTVTMDQHCALVEQYASAIGAAMLLAWSLLAFSVVMRA